MNAFRTLLPYILLAPLHVRYWPTVFTMTGWTFSANSSRGSNLGSSVTNSLLAGVHISLASSALSNPSK